MNRVISLMAAFQASGMLIWDVLRGKSPDEEPDALTGRDGVLVVAHRTEEDNLCVHLDNETTPREMKFLAEAMMGQAQWKEYVNQGVDQLSDSIRDGE